MSGIDQDKKDDAGEPPKPPNTPAPVAPLPYQPPAGAAAAGAAPSVPNESTKGEGWKLSDVASRVMDPKQLIKDGFAWLDRLYNHHPRAFGLTALGVLALACVLKVFGMDALAFVPVLARLPEQIESVPAVRVLSAAADLAENRDCIAKGKELSRKYVLLNVVQLVQYEQSPDKANRQVEQRIVYTLLPLTDIAASDQVFSEDYQGSGTTERWYGPRRETAMPGTNRFQVSFSGKRGVPLVLVTGARMTYSLPFPPHRTAFRQKVGLSSTQDFWVYENTEDVICSMTQVIDSRTLRLVPIDRGGHRVGNDGKHGEADVETQPASIPPRPNAALSATWSMVVPGEDVGLAFEW